MPTVHLLVEGKVQGVFFRASTKEVAKQLQIGGWVRNTPDNKVEIYATGTKAKLMQLIDWCKKGPPRANVLNVREEWLENEIPFEHFFIKKENGREE
jgi:acylphosphatase